MNRSEKLQHVDRVATVMYQSCVSQKGGLLMVGFSENEPVVMALTRQAEYWQRALYFVAMASQPEVKGEVGDDLRVV